MSIRIITDSASDMSLAEHPALRVLPLSVTFGTDVYMDGVDIDHQRFYEMLVERDELPKTGQVNPYAFSQAIAEAREAGDEAVIITVGAKLSGTNQSARTALAEAPGGDVFVVDSNNVTLGERVLVEYALRLVDEGRSAAQIAAAVEAVRDRVVVIGLLETLEYLVRGGRLSAAAGAVGTLLNVKPVVAAEDGLIVQLGKARGSKNGRNLLNQKVEKAGGVDFSGQEVDRFSAAQGVRDERIDALAVVDVDVQVGESPGKSQRLERGIQKSQFVVPRFERELYENSISHLGAVQEFGGLR